jgi:hypothetical protein
VFEMKPDDGPPLELSEMRRISHLLEVNAKNFLRIRHPEEREAFVEKWFMRHEQPLDGEATNIIEISTPNLFFFAFLKHLTTEDYRDSLGDFLKYVSKNIHKSGNADQEFIQAILKRIGIEAQSDATVYHEPSVYQKWDVESKGNLLGDAISNNRNTIAYVEEILEFTLRPDLVFNSLDAYQLVRSWLQYPNRSLHLREKYPILRHHDVSIGQDKLPNILNGWQHNSKELIQIPKDDRLVDLANCLSVAMSNVLFAEEVIPKTWRDQWLTIAYKIVKNDEGRRKTANYPVVYACIKCLGQVHKHLFPWLEHHHLQRAWQTSAILAGLQSAQTQTNKNTHHIGEAFLYLALVSGKYLSLPVAT